MKLKLWFFFLVQSSIALSAVSPDILKSNFRGKNYSPVFETCLFSHGNSEKLVTKIRQFQMMNNGSLKNFALVVDDTTLQTSVETESSLRDCQYSDMASNYQRALFNETADGVDTTRNAGATHALNSNQSMYLTVDLCPSHKAMDIDLFKKIQGGVKPVPVAISVSGLWLLKHGQDFEKLLEMQKNGDINILWVNHTYDHPYNSKMPNEHNFVLLPGVNIADEVFDNEKLLLQNGIVPSVFFRFPGLVSNQEDVLLLRKWGLIPLGADAWLAKGEIPQIGSFILVHGNGNEPIGLKILYDILNKFPDMRNEFAPLNEAFQ
jgi:hypothetical protein